MAYERRDDELCAKKNPHFCGLSTPKGSRTPVLWLRTRYPRPLDDGGVCARLLRLSLVCGIMERVGGGVKPSGHVDGAGIWRARSISSRGQPMSATRTSPVYWRDAGLAKPAF